MCDCLLLILEGFIGRSQDCNSKDMVLELWCLTYRPGIVFFWLCYAVQCCGKSKAVGIGRMEGGRHMGAAVTFLCSPLSCRMHSSNFQPGTGTLRILLFYVGHSLRSPMKIWCLQRIMSHIAQAHTHTLIYELLMIHIIILLLEFTELWLKFS